MIIDVPRRFSCDATVPWVIDLRWDKFSWLLRKKPGQCCWFLSMDNTVETLNCRIVISNNFCDH